MSKRKKQIIVLIISIVVIIGSVSYALWSRTVTQATVNELESGCFDVNIDLDGEAIKLAYTYPITDEEGLRLTPYTITITNKCTIDAEYNVNLNLLDTENPISDSSIKVAVDDTAKLLTEYTPGSYDSSIYRGSYIIATGMLKSNKETKNGKRVTYSIRIWMDENTPISEAEKKFKAQFSVNATPTTIPDPGKLDISAFNDFTKNDFTNLINVYDETRNIESCYWIEDSNYQDGGYTDCRYEDITNKVFEVNHYIEKVYTVLTNEVPDDAISSADVSEENNGSVMAWYMDEDNNGMYELYIGSLSGIELPENSSKLFQSSLCGWDCVGIYNYLTYMDISNFDTSNVTNMNSMFSAVGRDASSFEMVGLDAWDVSNVANMQRLFHMVGYNASIISINGLEDWDVSHVTNMQTMFDSIGYYLSDFHLDLTSWRDKVLQVENYYLFNNNVQCKVISPFDDPNQQCNE